MKVWFPLKKNATTGKGLFLNRLATELKKVGVKFVSENDRPDIALFPHQLRVRTNARHLIVRYDGVYFNTRQDFRSQNKTIAAAMAKVTGVVYQGVFAKEMCDKFLGVFAGKSAIIPNGDDPGRFDSIQPAESPFKINMLAVARWRPHKRLRDTIESFLMADLEGSCLWVAGDLTHSGLKPAEIKKYRKRNIRFLGLLDQGALGSYYKLCSVSFHLCWYDWCPNSVVEAIAAGCVVITNNVGGTRELVSKSGGIICDIDDGREVRPLDLYNPPPFERSKVAKAIKSTLDNPPIIRRNSVHIKDVASSYETFFEEVLNE